MVIGASRTMTSSWPGVTRAGASISDRAPPNFIEAEKQAFLTAASAQRAGTSESLEAAWTRYNEALGEQIVAKHT